LSDGLGSWWSENVWQVDLNGLPAWHRRAVLFLRGTQVLINDLASGLQSLNAMALVYKTLLSLVPLLAVSFSVLKGFGVHNQLEPLLLGLMEPMGEKGVEVTTSILQFVDNTNVGALGAVGLGVLLYTVVSMVQQIEMAFNATWRVRHSRSIVERFSHYISVILVGPVLMFSALGLSQTVQRHPWFQQAVDTDTGAFLYNTLSIYLPFLMIVAAFTFLYMFMPNTRVKASAALFGAVVAALLFKGASSVFTMFIVGSTKYTAIYATFATMVIMILWTYFMWFIVLMGSSVAYYYQHAEKLQFLQRNTGLSPQNRDELAMQMMVLVIQQYYAGKPPLTVIRMSELLEMPDDIIEELARNLVRGGFLIETDGRKEAFTPGRPPEESSVSSLLKYLRNSSFEGDRGVRLRTDENVITALGAAESSAMSAVDDMTLKQLASIEDGESAKA
jgi:membrane protein